MAGNAAASGAAAAATAAGSADARFAPQERQSRWGGCFGGLSCFRSQKGGKRIVPASRMPDGNASANRANGPQSAAALSNQNTAMAFSLFAPPSSPASFTNSALPSTAQSPSCFLSLSANSPGGPSSAMYATGPYAHETQLVSPPVFSTYTTEPSTAPLTPPPELTHPTTPSSPDVPFARFFSSSLDLKHPGKDNGMHFSQSYAVGGDLQGNYSLYPGSPSSSLISPVPGTPRTGMSSPFPEQELSSQWGACLSADVAPCSKNGASKLFGRDSATSRNFMLSPGSSLFCPATSAQFCLDQAQQSYPYNHSGGKLNMSREADIYSSGGNKHTKPCKQDTEEIEAYRASFGFSADEIITTQNYVEILDPADDSFSISPFGNNKLCMEGCPENEPVSGGEKMTPTESSSLDRGSLKPEFGPVCGGSHAATLENSNVLSGTFLSGGRSLATEGSDETCSKTSESTVNKKILSGQSCSDAEIDYRRARSLRDAHGILAWRSSLP